MRPSRRPRKIAALLLLALLLPAWAAAGLPLVWCIGPNGHNAIEGLTVGCHDELGDSVHSGGFIADSDECTDFSLWQRIQVPSNPSTVASPSPDPIPVVASFESTDRGPQSDSVETFVPLDPIASQLAQLRTVVLLI